MPDRTLDLDGVALPACHACSAPAIVKRDRHGMTHVTWRHENDCAVLRSFVERLRLDAAVALAVKRERQGGDDA